MAKIAKKRKLTLKKVKIVRKAPQKAVRKSAVKKQVSRKARKPIKAVKKPAFIAPAAPVLPVLPKQKLVGVITHFYPNICVGVVEVKKDLKMGDFIIVLGHGRSFEQKVSSMQLEHRPLQIAKKGQLIGMKMAQEVKEKDLVYLK
jgi:putative protease